MFHIVLHNPVMAANTGNIIRLCANNGCALHLIEPLGFDLEEKKLRRAGLDYHDLSNVERYPNFAAFAEKFVGHNIYAITTKGTRGYTELQYQPGDVLLFGSETSGLPADVMGQIQPELRLRVPMMPNNRSLNLSNTVALVSYEAWRQHEFAGGS
ncbi:tRNA (uridine(34)/cytosine(34)/5-carboxymethylaminomethyluridine(34)-2'-O)-methyltransferase TrmL [Aliidiomarina iranensis]|uniref:tRNA (cytidine(34)-2'-O)-methyltransferase n=1 Tax=Aliidiomarina iranensis TaxID=1434071 RepID=A0A432VWF9_9GAMM|nr:tRNA (cytidine(34)-2'-O)-methyltransferase [Aliidiomarina iranensis]RUO20940.1 tRNA (uridine(34)/cytosine(34)/5-carboxymethylaminomethyluridine(34)-2'-O)-methyltransferase TrmL [Aliidiomarina iranensis]